MPHYFFHVRTDGELIRDEEGSELSDLAAARAEALQSAREMVGDAVRFGHNVYNSLVIADDTGRELAAVHLREVLPASLRK